MSDRKRCYYCGISSSDYQGFGRVGTRDVHFGCVQAAKDRIYRLVAQLEDWGYPVTVYMNGAEDCDNVEGQE